MLKTFTPDYIERREVERTLGKAIANGARWALRNSYTIENEDNGEEYPTEYVPTFVVATALNGDVVLSSEDEQDETAHTLAHSKDTLELYTAEDAEWAAAQDIGELLANNGGLLDDYLLQDAYRHEALENAE